MNGMMLNDFSKLCILTCIHILLYSRSLRLRFATIILPLPRHSYNPPWLVLDNLPNLIIKSPLLLVKLQSPCKHYDPYFQKFRHFLLMSPS